MRTSSHEDGGEEEFVEVPSTHIRRHRRDERHEQYVSDCIEGSGLITISLYAMEDDKNSDYASGEELIADSSSSVEEQALHDMDLEALHRALQTLNDDELRMIHPVTAKTSFTPSPHRSDTTRTIKEDILNTGWLISMQMRESPAPAWTSVTICIG